MVLFSLYVFIINIMTAVSRTDSVYMHRHMALCFPVV